MKKKFSVEELNSVLGGKEPPPDAHGEKQWFTSLSEEQVFRLVSFRLWRDLDKGKQQSSKDLSPLLGRVHHTINKETQARIIKLHRQNRLLNLFSRVAVVLLLSVLTFTFLNREKFIQRPAIEQAMARLHAPDGARTEFVLPDGTRGWLNNGSSISFPASFSEDLREVHLTGEAYFGVTASPSNPFVVYTARIQVEARGTVFTVNDYNDLSPVEVTLVEGKVDVMGEDETGKRQSLQLMEPGTHFRYDIQEHAMDYRSVNVAHYTSWIEGKLVFRGDLFSTVIKKLERWYNVDIEVRDQELLTHEYRATFENESLEEVLRLISLTAPIDYEIHHQKQNADLEYSRRRVVIKRKRG